VRHTRDRDKLRRVVDKVHNAPIAGPNAPLVLVALQLLASRGARITRKCEDLSIDSSEEGVVERT
jgi:hypothetical protein